MFIADARPEISGSAESRVNIMHPLRPLAAPALVLLLCGALVGDDPKPEPPPAKAADLPPLFRKLGLTDEQVEAVAKVRDHHDAKVKELEEKIRAARDDEEAELEKVLTDAQRARLKELRKAAPKVEP
jgi:hypothetical protein